MRTRLFPATLLLAATAHAAAQSSALPAIVRLEPPAAKSERLFKFVTGIRVLPNGTILINEGRSNPRRVTLVDSALRVIRVVSDSLPPIPAQDGSPPSGMVGYLGDSTLFVEMLTPEIYVLDRSGKLQRTMALPNARDGFSLLLSISEGRLYGDKGGRLLYRGGNLRPSAIQAKPGQQLPFNYPDSAPIVRADLGTRKAGPIAWLRLGNVIGTNVGGPDGSTRTYVATNPTAATDDFSVLSSGTVVILRSDYHLDIVGTDGVMTSAPRIPYPWEKLTDSDKVALMDSVRTASERRAGQTATAGGAGGGGGAGTGPFGAPGDLVWAKPDQLADYRPAFAPRALHADLRDNLWVRTEQRPANPNTSIYDVINHEGALVGRVEIPRDRTIVGFDSTSLYLMGRDGGTAWLERVKLPGLQ